MSGVIAFCDHRIVRSYSFSSIQHCEGFGPHNTVMVLRHFHILWRLWHIMTRLSFFELRVDQITGIDYWQIDTEGMWLNYWAETAGRVSFWKFHAVKPAALKMRKKTFLSPIQCPVCKQQKLCFQLPSTAITYTMYRQTFFSYFIVWQ